MKPSIIRLRALEKQLYAYLYAMTVIDFDAETVAPEGSADGRAEATEVLSRASFDLLVNDGTAALLKEAAADAETEQERAEVRNLQRQYDEIARIPADEYAAFERDAALGGWKMLHYLMFKGVTRSMTDGMRFYAQYGVTYAEAGFLPTAEAARLIHARKPHVSGPPASSTFPTINSKGDHHGRHHPLHTLPRTLPP